MWFVYVLPFLFVGGIVFMIAWTCHADKKSYNERRDRQNKLNALRNGEKVAVETNSFIDDDRRMILSNYMWQEIAQINSKYAQYDFNNIRSTETFHYEKNTSMAKFSRGFNCYDYMFSIVYDELPKYKMLVDRYLKIYNIYHEYESQVLKIYDAKRLYKNMATAPKDERTALQKAFGITAEHRFEILQVFEEETFLKKTFRPKFPMITFRLTASYQGYTKEENHTYRFDKILEFYNAAVDKQGKLSFIKRERAKISDDVRYNVLKRDGFRCCICGATADDGVRLEVDHIIPVSKGGKSTYDNLQTLCERCNRGKRDK